MKTHPLRSVDCQLLYETYAPLTGEQVQEIIRSAVQQCGFPREACQLMRTSTEADIYMLLNDLQILVTQSLPLSDTSHIEPLTRDYAVSQAFPDAADVLTKCKAVTTISVQKFALGGVKVSDEFSEMLGPEFDCFCDSKSTKFALNIAKVIAVQVSLKTRCEGVFWGQNGYLLPAQRFAELAIQNDETLLYVRPHLHAPIQSVSDTRTFGVVASGAEHLIGYRVEFEPSTVPPAYMVENLHYFVAFCLQRQEVLPEGDVFGKNQDEKVRISYKQTEKDKPDRILLTVQSSAELGIEGEYRPSIYHQYDDNGERLSSTVSDVDVSGLDPNDPVDAAILDRLLAIKKASPPKPDAVVSPESAIAEEPTEARSATNEKTAEIGHSQEPKSSSSQSGPSQRVSLEELRRFARQAQVADAEPEAKTGKRAFLKKLFGK